MMSRLASSTAKRFLSTATTSSSSSSTSTLAKSSSSSSSSYSSSSISSSRFLPPSSRSVPNFHLPGRRLSTSPSSSASDSSIIGLKSFAPLQPHSLAGYPTTRITTLPNGLRVASESSGGHTATVGVWMDIGSRFEKSEDNGVAHFLEHLAFKGTPSRTRVQLESEVENMGGHLNAYTSREQSVYHAKVFSADVPKAFEILSDILKNSKLDADDINRERDVILREMQEVDANLSEVIFDRLHETAYRGTPLAKTILGSVENIRSINQAQLKKYIETHYTAPHMVIAGTGGVQHEELVRLAEKYFGDVPREPTNNIAPVLMPARFTGSDIRVRNDELHEAHVAIAFETAGWTDPDNFPLMIIQTLLGSWDVNVHGGQHSSSELVAAVAENRLANRYTTFNTQYSDTGLFGVYFIAEPLTLYAFTNTFCSSLTKLAREVDPVRLEEAKTLLKMTMLGHMDGNAQVAEDIGRQLLVYGRRLHPTEIIARIDAIDENAIKNAVHRFFWDRDFALAAIGPIFELPDYNWIRARTYSILY